MGDLLLAGIFTVPNLLTTLRILASPLVFCWALEQRYVAVVGLFFVAGMSDWLDGFWARHAQCASALGAFLDPLADKLLTFFSYLMLYNEFPKLSFCVIARDVLIVLAVGLGFLLKLDFKMSPLYISKVNTGFVLLLPFVWLLAKVFHGEWLSPILTVLTWVIFVTLVGSICAYLGVFCKACVARFG